MSFFKKKLWMIFAFILILIVALAAISKSGNNPLSNAVNTVWTPVLSTVSKVTVPVEKFVDFLSDMKHFEEENEQLRIENLELKSRLRSVSEYNAENERLKKLLGLSFQMEEYTSVNARVVAYEPDNWFSYITIDKGTKDGIEVSDTVVTANGLLGQVAEAGYNWAKISTIIDPESSVGVRIIRNGEIGIVEGDSKLTKTNKCKLGYLIANASVIAGDILETSGLGGIYPPGLLVGKINDVSKDNMGRLDYAVIEPFVEFEKLYEVTVITDWSLDSDVYIEPDNNNTVNENEQTDDVNSQEDLLVETEDVENTTDTTISVG